MTHSSASTVALLAFVTFASAAHAKVQVNGNVEQSATLSSSPLTAIAGSNATARNGINLVDGNVDVHGNLKQTAVLKSSPMTAIAGSNATAENLVNTLRGK